jgi:tetratricopeptide (TPR) repeat protein
MKHVELAMATLTQLIRQHPNQSQYYVKKGNLFFKMKLFDDATKFFDLALRVNPGDIDALLKKAEIKKAFGKRDEAEELNKKILELNSEEPRALSFLGTSFHI